MGLYSDDRGANIGLVIKKEDPIATEAIYDEQDFVTLGQCADAYIGLTAVYESLSTENGFELGRTHAVMFDQCVTRLTENLGIQRPEVLSLEAIQEGQCGAYYDFAMEGFIGDMWAKLKKIFSKIGDAIREFLTKHFTRMGILKKKLLNLQEVVGETDKDLKQAHMDDVPSSIKSQFPYSGTVSQTTVSQMIDTASMIQSVLSTTNTSAVKMSKRSVLDANFVTKLNALRKTSEDNKSRMESNEKEKSGKFFRSKEEKEKDKKLSERNEKIADKNKKLAQDIDEKKSKMSEAADIAEGIGSDDKDEGLEVVKAEFDTYMKSVEDNFRKLIQKPIPKGKTIVTVKVTKDEGIEVEFDRNVESPDGVTLGDKASIRELTGDMIKVLDETMKITEKANDVNNSIAKNIDAVDRLIKDLEKTEDALEARYKKILQNKVSQRLKLMQTFFSTYNKLNKNMLDAVADIADGVVTYGVTSLKYFG